MYVPAHFAETDPTVLHGLIRSHPLGTWVVWAGGGLVANHVPFLVDASRGPCGTLVGHIARANPVWKELLDTTPSVVVFHGAQKYITPSWYPAKWETGKVVPTWNYAVVHAHGSPRMIQDRTWLRSHVSALSDHHEAARPLPWTIEEAPDEYIDALLGAIVGIEIPLDSLQGKWKLSQNRSAADLTGTIAGLTAQGDEESRTLATLASEALARKRAAR